VRTDWRNLHPEVTVDDGGPSIPTTTVMTADVMPRSSAMLRVSARMLSTAPSNRGRRSSVGRLIQHTQLGMRARGSRQMRTAVTHPAANSCASRRVLRPRLTAKLAPAGDVQLAQKGAAHRSGCVSEDARFSRNSWKQTQSSPTFRSIKAAPFMPILTPQAIAESVSLRSCTPMMTP
jgi:hypothetical protein